MSVQLPGPAKKRKYLPSDRRRCRCTKCAQGKTDPTDANKNTPTVVKTTIRDKDRLVLAYDDSRDDVEWEAHFMLLRDIDPGSLKTKIGRGDDRLILGEGSMDAVVVLTACVKHLFDDGGYAVGKRRDGPMYSGEVWTLRELKALNYTISSLHPKNGYQL